MRAPDNDQRPALRAYMVRVGATEKNFRRWVVEEEDATAYTGTRRIADIRVAADGAITCDVEACKPTTDEQAAIRAEVAAKPFPKSIGATRSGYDAWLRSRPDSDEKHYAAFLSPNGKEVLFVQHRPNGEKPDLPWSLWLDNRWRQMEPDGKLPLFGLEKIKDALRIFVHEGARGARDVVDLISAHPWRAELETGAHIGWPGGVCRVRDVDWSPLQKLPRHVEIILVADNDQGGVDAVSEISAILGRSLKVLRFDDRFPPTHDLADPWPKQLFADGRYVGPAMVEMLEPATWATSEVKTSGRGRPSFEVRDEFAAEWHWLDNKIYIHRDQTDLLLGEERFNRLVRPFSDAEDTSRLLRHRFSSQAHDVAYDPGERPGVINRDGRRLVNTYRAPTIKAVKGDPAPFLNFMEHLIPDERDRLETLRWCATLIARPAVKMTYGLLLVSETQGVGKSTLGESILTPLVGKWNASTPTERDIVDSAFNAWIAHKRLAVIHEIYAGHSAQAYNRLKSVITEERMTVNQKYMPGYETDVRIHVIACSNSPRALRLDDADRRWFVPRVTEVTRPAEYWRELHHRWLDNGGLEIVMWWAHDWLQKNEPVRRGEHAPASTMKDELVAEGRSEGATIAYDLAVAAMEKYKDDKVILAVEAVRDWVAAWRGLKTTDNKMESPLTLRRAMRAAGMVEPARTGDRRQRFKPAHMGRMCYVLANFDIGPNADWKDLEGFYKRPEEIAGTNQNTSRDTAAPDVPF